MGPLLDRWAWNEGAARRSHLSALDPAPVRWSPAVQPAPSVARRAHHRHGIARSGGCASASVPRAQRRFRRGHAIPTPHVVPSTVPRDADPLAWPRLVTGHATRRSRKGIAPAAPGRGLGERWRPGQRGRTAQRARRAFPRLRPLPRHHPPPPRRRIHLSPPHRPRPARCSDPGPHPPPRHPSRLHPRLDLPRPLRPHPSHRPRRPRPQAVPLSHPVAHHPRRRQVRPHAGVRPGPAAHPRAGGA